MNSERNVALRCSRDDLQLVIVMNQQIRSGLELRVPRLELKIDEVIWLGTKEHAHTQEDCAVD